MTSPGATFTITVNVAGGPNEPYGAGDIENSFDTGVAFYARNDGTDVLLFAHPQGGALSGSLDYTAFGLWAPDASADLRTRSGPFDTTDAGIAYLGVVTGAANMPSAGTASYIGSALGMEAQVSEVQGLLNGTFEWTADFAAGRMSTEIALNRSTGGSFGTITAEDMIITAATSSFASAGMIEGNFFGPTAQEIGGQFNLSDGTTRVVGAFGGATDAFD